MTSRIYCKTTAKGIQSFYLIADGREYFLFKQNYRVSNKGAFTNGVTLDEAIAMRSHCSTSVRKTATKLVSYVRYIEQTYGICVLKKTVKKLGVNRKGGRRANTRDYGGVA